MIEAAANVAGNCLTPSETLGSRAFEVTRKAMPVLKMAVEDASPNCLTLRARRSLGGRSVCAAQDTYMEGGL